MAFWPLHAKEGPGILSGPYTLRLWSYLGATYHFRTDALTVQTAMQDAQALYDACTEGPDPDPAKPFGQRWCSRVEVGTRVRTGPRKFVWGGTLGSIWRPLPSAPLAGSGFQSVPMFAGSSTANGWQVVYSQLLGDQSPFSLSVTGGGEPFNQTFAVSARDGFGQRPAWNMADYDGATFPSEDQTGLIERVWSAQFGGFLVSRAFLGGADSSPVATLTRSNGDQLSTVLRQPIGPVVLSEPAFAVGEPPYMQRCALSWTGPDAVDVWVVCLAPATSDLFYNTVWATVPAAACRLEPGRFGFVAKSVQQELNGVWTVYGVTNDGRMTGTADAVTPPDPPAPAPKKRYPYVEFYPVLGVRIIYAERNGREYVYEAGDVGLLQARYYTRKAK